MIIYMKMKYTIPMLSAMLLLAACSTDDGTAGNGNDEQLPIVLQSSVPGTMRATTESHVTTQGNNQVLASGQNVDLFLDEDVVAGTTPTYTGQKFYLKTTAPSGADDAGVGNFTFYTDEARTSVVTRYWPPSGNGLYFYAYYPAGAISAPVAHTTTVTQTFTVSVAQGAASGSLAYDLLFGVPNANPIGTAATNPVARPTALTRAGSEVNLNFRHCMSKVVVNIQGDGYGIGNGTAGGPATGSNAHKNGYDQYGRDQFTNATITLGSDVYLQASVTPNSGVATAKADGTTGTVTLKNSGVANTTHSYYCILPPVQNITGKTLTLTLTDGGAKTYTIPTTEQLVAGKAYIYTITVGLYEIHVTATVGDWTDETMTPGTLKY